MEGREEEEGERRGGKRRREREEGRGEEGGGCVREGRGMAMERERWNLCMVFMELVSLRRGMGYDQGGSMDPAFHTIQPLIWIAKGRDFSEDLGCACGKRRHALLSSWASESRCAGKVACQLFERNMEMGWVVDSVGS